MSASAWKPTSAAGRLAFWLTGFGRQLRVLVVGAEDVGKSAVIALEQPVNTSPTAEQR